MVLVLIAVCCAAITAPLAFTGIAVGLPAISRELGGSPIQLNWALNAFILTFGSTLMAAGALADSYGRKKVFLSGLTAFGLLSIGLIFTSDIVWFDLLRALQGVGAAAAFAGGLAALAQEFDGAARLRAFSIVGANFGIGLAFRFRSPFFVRARLDPGAAVGSKEKPADVYATARKRRTAFRRGFQYQQLSFSIALATMEIEHGPKRNHEDPENNPAAPIARDGADG